MPKKSNFKNTILHELEDFATIMFSNFFETFLNNIYYSEQHDIVSASSLVDFTLAW